jgi:hypothetical protein
MRSILLELLRDGPPQNQLLSPLTRYFGLCGEHAAVAVQLPFEHAQWLSRMSSLAYGDSELTEEQQLAARRTRELQLADVAGTLGKVLEQIPGFVAELARCHSGSRDLADRQAQLGTVHLRLVMNANELALLPFELACAPSGFPAAGQALSLQTEVPLCITREIRRSSSIAPNWLRVPKLLFAFANPVSEVPHEAHLLALRRVIEPWVWVKSSSSDDYAKALRKAVSEHLTVLPHASLRALTELCATGAYTHVHILAHGTHLRAGDDRRFGLALHDSVDSQRLDIVDGERLATALRPHLHDRSQTLANPIAVSLAACDSGNVGSVVGAGASVAHELHLKGIPLVVASQFPLSIKGSIEIVSTLYHGLLWGQDPRCILDELRRRLRTQFSDNHDWASLVAYAALPVDMATQSNRLALQQGKRAINAALGPADDLVSEDHFFKDVDPRLPGHDDPLSFLLTKPLEKLSRAARHLKQLLECSPDDVGEIHGLLGATEKRHAELYVRGATSLLDGVLIRETPTSSSEKRKTQWDYHEEARKHLKLARDHYARSFNASRDSTWALVQSLTLDLALDKTGEMYSTPSWLDRWKLAQLLAERDIHGEDPQVKLWGHTSLVELYVLQAQANQALEQTKRVLELRDVRSFDTHSLWRQISRFNGLFDVVNRTTRPPRAGEPSTVSPASSGMARAAAAAMPVAELLQRGRDA